MSDDATQSENPIESAMKAAVKLSPRRGTSRAGDIDGLVREQLEHFGVDPATPMGRSLGNISRSLYAAGAEMDSLWSLTLRELSSLKKTDRIAYFNAKKFLCFQLAKILDDLQQPFRATYQTLITDQGARIAKGPYPIFDNVTAIFSATPVITRTATYLYACTEWIDQAFQGKEMLLEVYSRLLNPTSISLANHIVDLECGPRAREYMAWNFNSGMAAIDALLSLLLGRDDIVICSRNVYGGTFQLLQDWYAKETHLNVHVHWFDGYDANAFRSALESVRVTCRERLEKGSRVFVYLESPCNPHGYVLDAPEICKAAHEAGSLVMLDSTVATPALYRPLMREDPNERPDFVIHSYTKDITGTGTTTAGVVIGRNERMFLPKNEEASIKNDRGVPVVHNWKDTLFWDVYFIKGAFLDSDKAFEVINGSKTLTIRMLRKAIGTKVLARFLDSHPLISVKCNALSHDENRPLRKKLMRLGLPAPLFTFDFEKAGLDREIFTRFFDCLEPAFSHMVSLGQSNSLILCPALTSHSEMSPEELREAGIAPTTIRLSVGDEDVRTLIAQLILTARGVIDPAVPGFSERFMPLDEIDELFKNIYLATHRGWADSQPGIRELLE